MLGDRDCKLLQATRSLDSKRKKKKKKIKKVAASIRDNTEKLKAVSLPPETSCMPLLPPHGPGQPPAQQPGAPWQKGGEWLASSGRRSKKHHKDPLTASSKTSGCGELSTQARESLRWEGVLEDPQAEERRLELYRANRRQRYIAHRDALCAWRQALSKESKEKKGFN